MKRLLVRTNTLFPPLLALALLGALGAPAGAGQAVTVPPTATTPAVPAYVARPAGSAPAPGVLVLHDCGGYSQRYADLANGFAANGFVAVAIDSFAPRGVRNSCNDRSGARFQAQYARAALAWMSTQPYIDATRLAVVGYSMGANATLNLADPQQPTPVPSGLRAAVAYYPSCLNRTPANVVVPLLILIGDADDWTPAGPCHELAEAAADAGFPVSIMTYPGAMHGFDQNRPDRIAFGHHLGYDAAATADAAARTLTFLQAPTAAP